MKKLAIVSLIATLGGSSLALAHDGGKRHFTRMDADGDGRVTQQELLAQALAHFDSADSNKDGQVTKEERQQAFKQHGQERFQKKDENGDGELSQDELGRMPAERFTALDTDSSGGLSPDELKAGWKHGHGKRSRHDKRGGKHHPDFDGTWQRADVESHVAKRFARMDKNADQAVTEDEMGDCHKRGKRHHGGGRGHSRDADRDAG